MKMGELRAQADGSFVMQTPQGIQPVTLRCTNAGVVEVEEVAEGYLSTRVLEIRLMVNDETSRLIDSAELIARDIVDRSSLY